MEKTVDHKFAEGRENVLYKGLINFMYGISGPARTMLEVFSRSQFGERYFRLSSALLTAVVMAIVPFIIDLMSGTPMSRAVEYYKRKNGIAEEEPFVSEYLFWYIFLLAFVIMSIRHYVEKRRRFAVFNTLHYTKDKGTVHAFFKKIHLPFMPNTLRNIECYIEPGLFFLIGVFFYIIGQKVGVLLMVSGVLYSFSYIRLYQWGDDRVKDINDRGIVQRHMEAWFVTGFDEEETDGYRYRGDRPGDQAIRRRMLPELMPSGDDFMVESVMA